MVEAAAERLKRHPLSALWGPMADDVEKDFVDGIREHVDPEGLKIDVLDNMVLDGWWRYNAFLDEDVEPILVPYTGDDPAGFVRRRNGNRRHQSAGQRVLSIMDSYKYVQSQEEGEPSEIEREAAAADSLGLAETARVSRQTARQALRAEEAGVGDYVRRGDLAVRTAADIAGHEDILEDLKSGRIDAQKATEEVKSRKPLSRVERLEAQLAMARNEAAAHEEKISRLEEEVKFLKQYSDGDSEAEDVGRTFKGQQDMIRTLRTVTRRWMDNFDSMRRERDYWRSRSRRSESTGTRPAAGDPDFATGSDAGGDMIKTNEYLEAVDEFLDSGGPVPDGEVEVIAAKAEPAVPAVAPVPVSTSQEGSGLWDGEDDYDEEMFLYGADLNDSGMIERLIGSDDEGANPVAVDDDAPRGSISWDDPEELALSEIDDGFGYEDYGYDVRGAPFGRGTGARQVGERGYGPPNVLGDGGVLM